ncbi:hypothetical protein HDV02_005945 [Globomyces sp. JEL0801]|nr:hypothetical protein HDV02_005945 [Globomyces sp. JEL0801]
MNLSKDSKKHAGFFIKRLLSFYSVNTLLTILSKYKNFKLSQLVFNFKNLKSSIALALFPTVYQLLKRIIPNHVPEKYKNNRLVTHFVAGGMASICLYLDPNQSRISSLYTMIIVRTLHFFIRALVFKPNTVKSINQNDTENKLILRPFQSSKVKYIQNVVSKWGDWIVWLYVAYQICYMVVLQPNYLSKSYVKSLNVVMNQRSKYGDDFLDIIDGLQALILYLVNQEPSNPLNWIPAHKSSKQHLTDLMEKSDVTDLVKKLRSLLEIFPDNVHHERLVCACSHPKHSSCVLGAADQGFDSLILISRTDGI